MASRRRSRARKVVSSDERSRALAFERYAGSTENPVAAFLVAADLWEELGNLRRAQNIRAVAPQIETELREAQEDADAYQRETVLLWNPGQTNFLRTATSYRPGRSEVLIGRFSPRIRLEPSPQYYWVVVSGPDAWNFDHVTSAERFFKDMRSSYPYDTRLVRRRRGDSLWDEGRRFGFEP